MMAINDLFFKNLSTNTFSFLKVQFKTILDFAYKMVLN